jgi:hypothetical protein
MKKFDERRFDLEKFRDVEVKISNAFIVASENFGDND